MVAGLDAGDALAHFHHDARAFVAEHGGKEPFRIVAAEREGVGVADAGVGDAHQHFARARRRDVDLDDLQGLAGGESDGGAGFHRVSFLGGFGRSRIDRWHRRAAS